LFQNLSYHFTYQILAVIVALITSPYLSRVVGAEGLGTYSYSYSIVTYFTMIAMLGTTSYGSRTIAKAKASGQSIDKEFCSIYGLQLATSSIALILYCAFVLIFAGEDKNILWIQGIWILSCLFDINWFFFGIEEFNVTFIRNIVIKLITAIAIFAFVKTAGDTWLYIFILAVSNLLSQVVLWRFLIRRIKISCPNLKDVLSHIKPNIALFIPLIGTSVYTTMDKTMLGMLCTSTESGFYYNADKIMSIPLTLIIAAGTVMLPHMSSIAASQNKENERYVFNASFEFFLALSIGMSFGIAAIAKDFVPLYFGSGFEPCIVLVYIFSVIMVVKAITNIVKNQYIIPQSRERVYTFSVVVGAIVNLISNYLLIYVSKLGALGATIGTLVAEMAICFCYAFLIRKDVDILKNISNACLYIIPGIIMGATIIATGALINNRLIRVLVQVPVGVVIYTTLCILCWKLTPNRDLSTVFVTYKQKLLLRFNR